MPAAAALLDISLPHPVMLSCPLEYRSTMSTSLALTEHHLFGRAWARRDWRTTTKTRCSTVIYAFIILLLYVLLGCK